MPSYYGRRNRYNVRRRSHRHGAFAVQPRRLWYHRYQNAGAHIASTNVYYELMSLTGVNDSVKLVKEITCDIQVAPIIDTSSPYGRTNLVFAWMRRPEAGSNTDISDKDTLRLWRPRVLALVHTPTIIPHHIVMRWPRIEVSEEDSFRLVVWADAKPTGQGTDVSCSSHYLEAEHEGTSAGLLSRLEKLEAESSPPSVAPNLE